MRVGTTGGYPRHRKRDSDVGGIPFSIIACRNSSIIGLYFISTMTLPIAGLLFCLMSARLETVLLYAIH